MCRATSELWVAVSGTGVAGALTFLRLHWDAIRDRRAWRNAARNQQQPDHENHAPDAASKHDEPSDTNTPNRTD